MLKICQAKLVENQHKKFAYKIHELLQNDENKNIIKWTDSEYDAISIFNDCNNIGEIHMHDKSIFESEIMPKLCLKISIFNKAMNNHSFQRNNKIINGKEINV